jgi:hypothetical protein
MTYLTEEEKKMPINMMLMQVVLGLQTCKTKGDVRELLQEVYDIGYERGLNQSKGGKENGRTIKG